MGITYDAGALIAAERGERRMRAKHTVLLLRREVPVVPAPVVAQCWRGTFRQALLFRILAGCQVEPLDDLQARAIGTLAGRAGTTDVVGACVVEGALRRRDVVISSDPGDLAAICRRRRPPARHRSPLTSGQGAHRPLTGPADPVPLRAR